MSKTSVPKLLALAVLVPAAAAALASEERLRSSDHKKLGKEIAAWFEAKDESKGIDKAYLEISEAVDRIEKKLDGASALAMVEDWEQAFFQARLETLDRGIRARKGKPDEASATLPGGAEADFAIFLPKSYSERKGPYPLLLIVADEGQSPLTLLEEQWSDEGLTDEAILLAPQMPADTSSWTEISAAGGPGGIGTLMSLYGQMLRQFPIDMDRVYVVGHGAGALAAGHVAGLYPQLFAGCVSMDGAVAPDATNFRSLPTLVVGGGEGGAALAAAVEELGYGNCTQLEEGGAADVWSWCADKVRDPYPDTITFVPQSPYATSAHWITLEGVDVEAGPRIEARVDRDANTVVIDAEKVTTIQLFFNDVLLDLDRVVKVTINGVTDERTVPRNKRLMLDLNYSLGDWGRVFTNRQAYDVPLEQAK